MNKLKEKVELNAVLCMMGSFLFSMLLVCLIFWVIEYKDVIDRLGEQVSVYFISNPLVLVGVLFSLLCLGVSLLVKVE